MLYLNIHLEEIKSSSEDKTKSILYNSNNITVDQ